MASVKSADLAPHHGGDFYFIFFEVRVDKSSLVRALYGRRDVGALCAAHPLF